MWQELKNRLDTITGFQFFHVMRQAGLIALAVILAKSGTSTETIGQFEFFLMIGAMISSFWVSGLVKGLLVIFPKHEDQAGVLFQGFLLLLFGSVLTVAFLIAYQYSSGFFENSLLLRSLVLYILINGAACLTENILLLKNLKKHLFYYGIYNAVVLPGLALMGLHDGISIEWLFQIVILFTASKWLFLAVLLYHHSRVCFHFSMMRRLLVLSIPLMLGIALSGSAEYIDGLIVKHYYSDEVFGIFRYGAREFPLFLLLASALSTAMVARVSANLESGLVEIKRRSTTLLHTSIPISVCLLFLSYWVFPLVFNPQFLESALLFNTYILLLIPRLLFPQSVVIGLGHTKAITFAALLELFVNVTLSLWWIELFGLIGIAYATVVAMLLDKLLLVVYLKHFHGISPGRYIPTVWVGFYALLLVGAYYISAQLLQFPQIP